MKITINKIFVRLFADILYPINRVVEFYDDLDHSNYLGLKWEEVHVGRSGIGIDKNDTDFDTIGKKIGSKYIQEHEHYDEKLTAPYSDLASGLDRMHFSGPDHPKSLIVPVKSGKVTGVQTGNDGNIQPSEITSYWRRVG